MTYWIKSLAIVLFWILMFSVSVFAATQGNIVINGTVSEIAAISVTDTSTGTDLSDLGGTAYSNTKVGEITLDSNDASGFKVTFVSAKNGFIGKASGGTANDEKIAYTVTLSNASGTLGSGISEPTLTNIAPVNGSGTDLNFTGSSASPTTTRKYDVGVTTAIKGLKAGSDYSDTLTIQIANL